MRDRTADLFRAREALSQLSYSPITVPSTTTNPPSKPIVSNRGAVARRALTIHKRCGNEEWGQLVGLGRFELPTSPLSGVRSNQLSYRPKLPKARAVRPIYGRYVHLSIRQCV